MSRRRNDGDQEFGSDSFLDIIANIVGILIILIVVAGVKVARQTPGRESPVHSAAVANADELVEEVGTGRVVTLPTEWPWPESAHNEADDAQTATGMSLTIPGLDVGSDDDVEQAIASLSEPAVTPDSSEELDQQIAALTLNLEKAQNTTATTEAELQKLLAFMEENKQDDQLQKVRLKSLSEEKSRLTETVFQLQQSLLQADEKANSFQTTLASMHKRQNYIHGALGQVAEETRRLREVLEETETHEPAGERLKHRLSPVSESVVEGELHFRLHDGHIAHIPLESLLARLKTQVSNRRSVIMKFHRYEGLVGPVEGFRLQYIVQRQSISPLESLRYGGNSYRVSVARWTIIPAETLRAESMDAAVRIGSRFRQLLETTDPDTVVTVWLYPDDFQHFHRLRGLAHNLNLRVAARPLPEGTPIAGSPNGSRSTSQ